MSRARARRRSPVASRSRRSSSSTPSTRRGRLGRRTCGASGPGCLPLPGSRSGASRSRPATSRVAAAPGSGPGGRRCAPGARGRRAAALRAAPRARLRRRPSRSGRRREQGRAIVPPRPGNRPLRGPPPRRAGRRRSASAARSAPLYPAQVSESVLPDPRCATIPEGVRFAAASAPLPHSRRSDGALLGAPLGLVGALRRLILLERLGGVDIAQRGEARHQRPVPPRRRSALRGSSRARSPSCRRTRGAREYGARGRHCRSPPSRRVLRPRRTRR